MPFNKAQDEAAVQAIMQAAELLQGLCTEHGVPFLLNIVFQEDDQNYDAATWGMNGGQVESSQLIDQFAFLQRHRNGIQALLKQCGNMAAVHQRFAAEVAQVHQEGSQNEQH